MLFVTCVTLFMTPIVIYMFGTLFYRSNMFSKHLNHFLDMFQHLTLSKEYILGNNNM